MKTRMAIKKRYMIEITAFPATHNLLVEFIKRFFTTEHKNISGEPIIKGETV